MNRTQLYEIAVTTAKTILTETDPGKVDVAIGTAKDANNIAPADYSIFKQYVTQMRANYMQMSAQLLPSEQASARAKPAATKETETIPAT